MRGAENDEPKMSFRHGYQQGAIEVFYAIEPFLDPTTRGRAYALFDVINSNSRRPGSSYLALSATVLALTRSKLVDQKSTMPSALEARAAASIRRASSR